jgi:hypothetical protein
MAVRKVTPDEPVHKGSSRKYFCPSWLTADKKQFVPEVVEEARKLGICQPEWVRTGQPLPTCPTCRVDMVKRRNLSQTERNAEALHKSQLHIDGLGRDICIWTDVGRRKAKCRMCRENIDAGEHRIAFDAAQALPRDHWGPSGASGRITRRRAYVHRTCFVDMLFGGRAGEGCPGCTVKVMNDEYQEYKKMIKKRIERGNV